MLGRFLEYSIGVEALGPSFEFYRALGFSSVPVGDQVTEPYLAMFDGAIAVGLYDHSDTAARLTFVRPELRAYVRALRRLDIELDDAHLGDGEFNRVRFTEPGGQAVTLVEARTFPPPAWDPHNVATCGEFLEVTLPAQDLSRSSQFWQALGFAVVEHGAAPHEWQRLAGYGLTIGLHEAHCRPGLSFRCVALEARFEYLRAKGLAPRAGCPVADAAQSSATLTAPEGTPLYLLEKGAQ